MIIKTEEYLKMKNALLKELNGPISEERRETIFEELASINKVIKETDPQEKIRACV